MRILTSRNSQYPHEEMTMNLKLIAATMLFLVSASAGAARVESEEAQAYGAKANVMRQVIGAVSTPDGEKCDFGEPSFQTGRLSIADTFGRSVCNKA
jgi:hypothetical protein